MSPKLLAVAFAGVVVVCASAAAGYLWWMKTAPPTPPPDSNPNPTSIQSESPYHHSLTFNLGRFIDSRSNLVIEDAVVIAANEAIFTLDGKTKKTIIPTALKFRDLSVCIVLSREQTTESEISQKISKYPHLFQKYDLGQKLSISFVTDVDAYLSALPVPRERSLCHDNYLDLMRKWQAKRTVQLTSLIRNRNTEIDYLLPVSMSGRMDY